MKQSKQSTAAHHAAASRRKRGDYRTMTPMHERNLIRRIKRGCEALGRRLCLSRERVRRIELVVATKLRLYLAKRASKALLAA